jgi:hypothetical protein
MRRSWVRLFSHNQQRIEDFRKKIWTSIPLVSLKQGSSLNIVSTKEVEKVHVKIIPQLSRDETLVTVQQQLLRHDDKKEVHVQVSMPSPDSATIQIGLHPKVIEQQQENHQQQQQQQQQQGSKKKKNKKKGVKGSLCTSSDLSQLELQEHPEQSFGLGNPRNFEYGTTNGQPNLSTTNNMVDFMRYEVDEEPLLLENEGGDEVDDGVIQIIAKIPQTMDIVACQLDGKDSSITVEGPKLEGQAFYLKSTGNITVAKMRGHVIDISTTSVGAIFIKQLLEAQSVHLLTPTCGRIRALQIHANTINAAVQPPTENNHHQPTAHATAANCHPKLDDDDTLARIDISSLYASSSLSPSISSFDTIPNTSNSKNDQIPADYAEIDGSGAFLCVDVPGGTSDYPRNVRIKSNHGYISVYTVLSSTASSIVTSDNNHTNSDQDNIALVELGGVNGYCDIIIDKEGDELNDDRWSSMKQPTVTAVKAHFDSVLPNYVSAITSETGGQVNVSFDRKLETDVRLFVAPDLSPLDFNGLVSEDINVIDQTLQKWDSSLADAGKGRGDITSGKIDVITPYFQESNNNTSQMILKDQHKDHSIVRSVQGTVCNKIDPVSRWDVKSRGKINLESAEGQALNKFGGQESNEQHRRHMLVVASVGSIHLESLSWMEAIARRYGFDGSSYSKHISTSDKDKFPQQ